MNTSVDSMDANASFSELLRQHQECFQRHIDLLAQVENQVLARSQNLVQHVDPVALMKERAQACVEDVMQLRSWDVLWNWTPNNHHAMRQGNSSQTNATPLKRRSESVDSTSAQNARSGSQIYSKRRRIIKQEPHIIHGETVLPTVESSQASHPIATRKRRSSSIDEDSCPSDMKLTQPDTKRQRTIKEEPVSFGSKESEPSRPNISQMINSSKYVKIESPLPSRVKVESPGLRAQDDIFVKAETPATEAESNEEYRNMDIEYEDISAEVEARLRANTERRRNKAINENRPASKRKRDRVSEGSEGQAARRVSLNRAAKSARTMPLNAESMGIIA